MHKQIENRKSSEWVHQRKIQRAVRTYLEKQLDPLGPTASRGGSVPEFLRKPIATCDFPGRGVLDPLSPLWIRAWLGQNFSPPNTSYICEGKALKYCAKLLAHLSLSNKYKINWPFFDFISYLVHCCTLPDKRCLSYRMCLYQVMTALHFFNDVANDAESTQTR